MPSDKDVLFSPLMHENYKFQAVPIFGWVT